MNSTRWPHPEYDAHDEPHFLFLITPPYSGSTAIVKLLDSSPRSMLLNERGEGQWMIPGLCEKDRWDPGKKVNYQSVRAVWLHEYQRRKALDARIDVVIEKSPPNMMRIEEISACFRSCSFIANNRNPYASSSSILYRQHDADNLESGKRRLHLEGITGQWVLRSRVIRELVGRLGVPLVTYEQFCGDTGLLLDQLPAPEGFAATVDPNARVKVKDYPVQGIASQNHRQIARLRPEEISACSEILRHHGDLIGFFDYAIL